MTSSAIQAVNLSKRYQLSSRRQGYRTLRESLMSAARWPLHAIKNLGRSNDQEWLWALDHVSFEIAQGDIVGVIGRNGAGKSTLLKILSRITEPTEGYADIRGRVGSLLEVGTGFHPELSGRENIFLNGAILGMKGKEIARKLDAIVDFAEVERFLDTPVKRYSSGMYLRLAFAVAAHMEPDILLVDEVLAVGDVSFQKKCLGRMEDVAHDGRTVLFVSHNIGAVRALCNKGLYLEAGKVAESESLPKCIERYYRAIGVIEADDANPDRSRAGFGRIRVAGGGNTIRQDRPFELSSTFEHPGDFTGFRLFGILEDMYGRTLLHLCEESPALGLAEIGAGRYDVKLTLPPLWLNAGLYSFHFKVILWCEGQSVRYVSDKFPLDIDGDCSTADAILAPQGGWQVQYDGSNKPIPIAGQ